MPRRPCPRERGIIARVKAIREFFDSRPWYFRFAYYALGFGAASYFLIADRSAGWAVVSGLLFATTMTILDVRRLRSRRRAAS